jgi:hypothetical protein
MFKRLLLMTLVLFIIGTGLYYIKDQTNYQKSPISAVSGQKLLEKLDTKALNQINIRVDGTDLSLLQLQGGGWQEESLSYEADTQPIQDLLLNLSQIRLGDLVTNDPEHHERFRLLSPPEKLEEWSKERHADSVTLLHGDGTLILSLLLGKERSNGEGQYVRHAGSDKVYLISERLSVDSAVNDWLKKDLLAIESAQITGIKLQNGEGLSFVVNRDNAEAEWKPAAENVNTPDSERIKKMLDRLASLSFAKLYNKDVAPQQLEGSEIEEDTLLVSLFDGRIYTLNLQNNVASNGNYVLSMRMGILQNESGSATAEDSNLRQEMNLFNQRVNGRFFEISSWEGNELLHSDQ